MQLCLYLSRRGHINLPKKFFAQLARLESENQSFVLATVVESGGSTPRVSGARMAITADRFFGTIGGGALEYRIIQDARALLTNPKQTTELVSVHLVRDLAMCCGGKMSVFLDKVEATPLLWIFGAGHVGTQLAEFAVKTGFRVQVVDDRPEWASTTRFTGAVKVVEDDPETIIKKHPPKDDDYVVVTTHEHALDEAIIRALAAHSLRFLGVIGSRGKWARFVNRFEARGLQDEAIARVQCPVGIDIGAQTPEEIAISILAQLIAIRRKESHRGGATE